MQIRLVNLGIIRTVIGIITVVAFAASCPNGGSDNTDQANARKAVPPAVNAGSSDSESAAESKTAGEAISAEAKVNHDNADEEFDTNNDPLVFPERKGDPSLAGKWFALFGHHDLGLMRHSWVDGHNVEFRQNGQAFWYRVVNGAEVDTMDSQWSMKGDNQLKLSFSAAKAVETGLSKLAPMGIGSDEEIGLASGGISGGNASAMVLLDAVMDIQLDHNYLVIRDSYSRLMVYGREPVENSETTPGIEGDWIGKGASQRQFEARFEMNGDNIGAVMDHQTKEFSGVFAKGYMVGEMLSSNGMELVAFIYDDLGFLDGVRYTKPFRVVTMEYEFVKAPDSV